jgi:uncharacterized membrane protein YeaQ/YmgE (transglycosylase-associated protein family)
MRHPRRPVGGAPNRGTRRNGVLWALIIGLIVGAVAKFIMPVIGAILLLWIYRLIVRRDRPV